MLRGPGIDRLPWRSLATAENQPRKGTRRVAPWTAETGVSFSMRSLLSRISGALRPSSKPSERSAHPGEGARLSKLRLGKAVTSHTQSMGFATTCFPFTPWALFRCDRLKRTRTRIGRSNHSCNASLKSEWDWPGRSCSVQSSHIPNWSHAGQMLIQKRNPQAMPSSGSLVCRASGPAQASVGGPAGGAGLVLALGFEGKPPLRVMVPLPPSWTGGGGFPLAG